MFDFRSVYRQATANLNAIDDDYIRSVEQATDLLESSFRSGGKVLVFGNGGSAADAQHIAAELVGRFSRLRDPLPAVALTTNPALLTAWSNDAGYADAFARELRALGRPGDVAWGISTSGNSPSVVNALKAARDMGIRTLGLTRANGGAMKDYCDVTIAARATETPRIQELHLVTYHAICAAIEARLFGSRVELAMSLRIACDLDGTVADMDAALQREARRLFGADIDLHAAPGDRLESAEDVEGHMTPSTDAQPTPPVAASGGRPLTPGELRRLWQHVAGIENFWMSLGEVEPGAVARLAALATQHRWDVIFLTQRPSSAGDTTQVQSQRWLKSHGFELPSVMVMRGSRGKVAAALSLDVVLDDRPQNCLDVIADSKAKPILIWRFGAERVPVSATNLGIEAVSSMADALACLEDMTGERTRGRSVLGRLRRALGRSK